MGALTLEVVVCAGEHALWGPNAWAQQTSTTRCGLLWGVLIDTDLRDDLTHKSERVLLRVSVAARVSLVLIQCPREGSGWGMSWNQAVLRQYLWTILGWLSTQPVSLHLSPPKVTCGQTSAAPALFRSRVLCSLFSGFSSFCPLLISGSHQLTHDSKLRLLFCPEHFLRQ